MIDWRPIETFPKNTQYNGRLLVWLVSGNGLLIWGGPRAELAYWGAGLRRSQGISLFVQETDGETVDVFKNVSHWAIITPPPKD